MTRWLAILATAVLIALLTYVGPAGYADALSVEADMKIMRAQIASRSEHITASADSTQPSEVAPPGWERRQSAAFLLLTHPLHCGYWIRNCSDFQPCVERCLEKR